MPQQDPLDEPRIHDRTEAPRGVIPKNAQAWVLGLIALVMVLIIFFSGGPTKTKEPRGTSSAAPLVAASPAPATIDDFAAHLSDRAKKLEEAKAALEVEQKEVIARTAAPLRYQDLRDESYLPAGRGYRPAESEAPAAVPKSPVQQEQDKRESQAPYASSIALTYRQSTPATVPPAPGNALGAAPATPSLLDLLNADTSLASAAAAQFGASSLMRAPAAGAVPQPAVPSKPVAVAAPVPAPSTAQNVPAMPSEKHYTLFEGTIIETALTNRLNATFSGPVVCIVTTDVYSQNGRHLLIPRGSRAIGEVRQVDNFGQQRVAVSFHRVILPNEQSITLDQFVGLNQIGETGLRDQVNHHYLQIFGAAVAVGAISGLSQANTRSGQNASSLDVYRQGAASSLAQSSMSILDRFLNILPTFTIREGHRIKVYLSQDLELPEYSEEDERP